MPIRLPLTPIPANRLLVSLLKVQGSLESSLEVWFTLRPSLVWHRVPSLALADNRMPEMHNRMPKTDSRIPKLVQTNKDVSVAIQIGNKVFSLEAWNK